MWETIASAGIPPVVNSISGLLGARSNRKEAMRMWRKQQEYNHPKRQMARLESAGINPHLAFSSGNINNVSQSQPAVMPLELGQMTTADMMTSANIDQTKATTELKIAQEQTENWRGASEEAKAIINEFAAAVTQGKFGQFSSAIGHQEVEVHQQVQDYARELRTAEISENQARELVGNMEGRLAENNMTPNDSMMLRALVALFEQMGFNIDDVEIENLN